VRFYLATSVSWEVANSKPPLTGIRVFNLICWLIFPVSLMYLGIFILWALMIVMVNRFFLNLRRRGSVLQHKSRGRFPEDTCTSCFFQSCAKHEHLRRGTMVDNEGFSTLDPTTSVGIVGIDVTCTERRGRLLDNQWPIGLAPMPAKAHALGHFLPRGSSPKQAQM